MAINQFINVTIDPAASKKPDNADHKHTVAQGSSAASTGLSLGYDSAIFTTQSLLRSGVMAALQIAAGQLPK